MKTEIEKKTIGIKIVNSEKSQEKGNKREKTE